MRFLPLLIRFSLVNNAGIWTSRAAKKPEDGPEAYAEAMFADELEDSWQKCRLLRLD